ncbi:daxx-like protein isoform X3 [Ptiloglossa arizonensis]|uniref:daxx-like protein isoform X3 n=1 Tax=Ptiloglossa arizonensis TaxID=3350558 RepID=UPI003F9FE10F
MEKDEIICISSDDDEEAGKNKSSGKETSVTAQLKNKCYSHVKMEILPNENQKVTSCGQKRKAYEMIDVDENDFEGIKKVISGDEENNVVSSDVKKNFDECISVRGNEKSVSILRPKLVVKERKSFSPVLQDIFPMFISLCLQKDRSEDMKTITNKLKRRYEQLDPAYANSEAFITFLNEKRNDIASSSNKLFVYISEVMNEMKNSCNGVSILLNGKNCTSNVKKPNNRNLNVPGTSSSKLASTNNSEINNRMQGTSESNEENQAKYNAAQKEINVLLKAMKKCEKYIKVLEESEINFDDENNSSYIKLEKYRYRMVELYNKLCECTGENADAGRQYLRPKHFSRTGIVAVDHAITSFINSKISKRSKLKKVGAYASALIFPDYSDILQCVKKCNDLHNLRLDNKKQQHIAKNAFTELGEHLQRSRRNDYWDTFSLFLENKEDDPALKDPQLAEKLTKNKLEGENRLTNVFQMYVKKQEEMKSHFFDTKSSSNNEEEKEDSADNDMEDSNDEDNDVNEDDTTLKANTDKSSTEEDEISLDGTKVFKYNTDTTNKTSIDVTDFDIIEINEKCQTDANDRLKDINDDKLELTNTGDVVNTENDNLKSTTSGNVVNTNDDNLKSTNPDDIVNIPSYKSNSKSERTNENDATPSSNISPNLTLSAKVDTKILIDRAKENEPNIMIEESTDDKPLGEEKPLLRVRSFAKPPTTWEDVHEKIDKATVDESTLINSGIVDLTNDTLNQNSTSTKCTTIHIGSKVLPIMKGKFKTLVIPAGKSIIKKVQAVTSLHKVVGINRGSTIVRLPSNQSSNQQTNTSNQGKDLLAKQSSPIIQIPHSNQTILLTTKQKESSLQSSTTNSSISKAT